MENNGVLKNLETWVNFIVFFRSLAFFTKKNRKFAARNKNLKNKQHKNELMKKRLPVCIHTCLL